MNPPNITHDSDGSESAIRPPSLMKGKRRRGVNTEEEKKKAVFEEVKTFNAECLALEKLEADICSLHAIMFKRHGKLLETLNEEQWPNTPRRAASQMSLPSFRAVLHNSKASTAPEATREAVTALQNMVLLKFAQEFEKAEIALGVVGTAIHSALINRRGYGEDEEDIRELMGENVDRTYTNIRQDRAALKKAARDCFYQALAPLRKLADAFYNFRFDAAKNCDIEKLRGYYDKSRDNQHDHIVDLVYGLCVANDRNILLEEAYFEKGEKLEAALTYVSSLEEGDLAAQTYGVLNIGSRRDLRKLFPEVIAESLIV
ncbi:hypothetical protein CB0940_06401 [Cercospora beticola]|uniref:Uncharacterized protein n=1 Tax=Cercospora beticola TaxID=122368 RepID=A0A2G5I109_CERBT|nr:hypothetical protein CB0940_06401 [Cercospora beticola]PIA98476.1 hypothetical protein CB0940_06401 [Cercospora beticola]WPA99033.1 hypothetical protein RHO25_003647 [Cercospora beticola]CAK1360340.1 unnamed protein product [Cercospora beticola]